MTSYSFVLFSDCLGWGERPAYIRNGKQPGGGHHTSKILKKEE